MKRVYKYACTGIGLLIFLMFAPSVLLQDVNSEMQNVKILIDAGHGGKYLRQKNKKDLCVRTGLKKYANKPEMECVIRQAEDYIDVNRDDMAVRNSYPVGEREIHGDRW